MATTDRHEEEAIGEDQRSPFERDRDRILYSSAFRRLAGVTQVANPTEGHIFHNRLTHTIKVAQLARRLAQLLTQRDKGQAESRDIDVEAVEAAALAHDLGHPPFGHLGEVALNDCMSEFGRDENGCSEGYDGNAQSFRIVTKLAIRREGASGLNLCRLTLNAILKYPWLREAAGTKSSKWGAYHSEQDLLTFARDALQGDEQHACAFLMDWADDIAYSTHDVEDFYRARILPLDRLARDEGERQRFLASQYHDTDKRAKAATHLDAVIGLIGTPLDVPFEGTEEQRGALRLFVSTLVGKCVRAVSFDGDGSRHPGLKVEDVWRERVNVLKRLARYYVFSNPALATQQFGQKRILRETFAALFDAATHPSEGSIPRNADLLPVSIRHHFSVPNVHAPKSTAARHVADAIAMMTEQELFTLHQRLTGRNPGSILTSIIL